MSFFDYFSRKRKAAAQQRAHKQWWETAAEFPADELFYEPMRSEFDPQGSYTGSPLDGEEPIQDADDL